MSGLNGVGAWHSRSPRHRHHGNGLAWGAITTATLSLIGLIATLAVMHYRVDAQGRAIESIVTSVHRIDLNVAEMRGALGLSPGTK